MQILDVTGNNKNDGQITSSTTTTTTLLPPIIITSEEETQPSPPIVTTVKAIEAKILPTISPNAMAAVLQQREEEENVTVEDTALASTKSEKCPACTLKESVFYWNLSFLLDTVKLKSRHNRLYDANTDSLILEIYNFSKRSEAYLKGNLHLPLNQRSDFQNVFDALRDIKQLVQRLSEKEIQNLTKLLERSEQASLLAIETAMTLANRLYELAPRAVVQQQLQNLTRIVDNFEEKANKSLVTAIGQVSGELKREIKKLNTIVQDLRDSRSAEMENLTRSILEISKEPEIVVVAADSGVKGEMQNLNTAIRELRESQSEELENLTRTLLERTKETDFSPQTNLSIAATSERRYFPLIDNTWLEFNFERLIYWTVSAVLIFLLLLVCICRFCCCCRKKKAARCRCNPVREKGIFLLP